MVTTVEIHTHHNDLQSLQLTYDGFFDSIRFASPSGNDGI